MDDDLQDRLRRLGVVKGPRSLKPAASPKQRGGVARPPFARITRGFSPAGRSRDQSLETLVPGGRLEVGELGAFYVVDDVYPLERRHGLHRLADLLSQKPETLADYCGEDRLKPLSFEDFIFLDTETTGLAGAGTLAFMVGVAFFTKGPTGDVLIVRQYFLRDHGDEPEMLRSLANLLADKPGLITFNGRSFDLPLLENRFLLNRMPISLTDRPHVDLLIPSRRLWRYRLGSCSLSSLEKNLLAVHRSQEDIPGWRIPGLYQDYLRSGDAGEMSRVFYHNQIDMLSMVTLAIQIVSLLANSEGHDQPVDVFSLGKWQADLGLTAESERNLRLASQGDMPLAMYHQALHRLGWLLKRDGRREEAVTVWQQLAATSFEDVQAHVELAKYYEWHAKDVTQAIEWTHQALRLVDNWSSAAKAKLARSELLHRLERLQRKNSRGKS